MAIYRVQAPDGTILKIEGPDNASDADVAAFAEQQVGAADYGFGSEMLSGLTFGFGDELRSKVTGEPIENIRAGQRAYREENPGTAMAANFAGSLPTLAIPGLGAANALRGIGMAGNVARGVSTIGTGAAYGGLSGAGESEEGQRAKDAGEGAAMGAMMAPIGAGLGRGIQMAASKARGKPAIMLPQDKAQAILLGQMEASKMTPEQARQMLLQDMSLGELSPTLTSLTGSVVRRVPESKDQFAQQALEAKAARPQQLLGRVQQELGAPDDSISMLDEATQRARQAAQPLYQRAYEEAKPIVLDEDLLKRPSVQKAFGVLNNMRAERGQEAVDLLRPLSLQDADLLKRAMDEVIYVGKDADIRPRPSNHTRYERDPLAVHE